MRHGPPPYHWHVMSDPHRPIFAARRRRSVVLGAFLAAALVIGGITAAIVVIGLQPSRLGPPLPSGFRRDAAADAAGHAQPGLVGAVRLSASTVRPAAVPAPGPRRLGA